jgi:UDP-glucuronate decarboxylase
MRPDDGRVVPTFLTQALHGQDLTVYGDGSQTRTFCYVDDLIRGLQRIMECDVMKGDVVNIGGQNEISITTLAETILEFCDTESELVYEPLPEDDPSRRRPHTEKAERLIDWDAETDLYKGLRQTMEYFKEHQRPASS